MHVHVASSGLLKAHPSPQRGLGSWPEEHLADRAVHQAPVRAACLLTECLMPRFSSWGWASSACSSPKGK